MSTSARNQLLTQAKIALADDYRPSNPVIQALSTKAFKASAEPNEKVLAELMSRMINLEQVHYPEARPQTSTKRKTPINPKHAQEARDIFEDVSKHYNISVEDPYFSSAIDDILSEYTIGYLSDLYDKSGYKQLHDILIDNYLPF